MVAKAKATAWADHLVFFYCVRLDDDEAFTAYPHNSLLLGSRFALHRLYRRDLKVIMIRSCF